MAFTLGAATGSFLGVVIERGMVFGRSRCDSCKRQLKWPENIPIVSYLLLRGRCRTCRSPIPYWLPLIEISGGLAGVWLASWANQTISVITFITIIKIIAAALIAAALIWIFFSDLVKGVIPDWAVAIGAVGAIVEKFAKLPTTLESFANFTTPALAAAGFFLFLVLVTRGRGMGTGDATLAAFLGLWLGWPKILLAVWLAFMLGAVAGLILIGLKLKRFGQTIPFGPFLIAASIIAAMANDSWMNIIGL